MYTRVVFTGLRDILCFGSTILSVFLSLAVSSGGRMSNAWVYMVLATLAVTPCFLHSSKNFAPGALFCYLVVMSVSSGLILTGVLTPPFFSFFLMGFILKFGVFPFMPWVYWVLKLVSWAPIYMLSVVSKVVAVFFTFSICGRLRYGGYLGFWCIITVIVLIPSFWVLNLTWVRI